MIYLRLTSDGSFLRVNPNMEAGLANRTLCNQKNKSETFLVVDKVLDGKEQISAYFLPWKSDTGYYIDLPKAATKDNYFFTAELTGCCVGVQRLTSGDIRVCHYNIHGEFDIDDLKRYNREGAERGWLLPYRYKDKTGNIKCKFYSGYSGGKCPTVFWGEYDDESKDWKFYYQLHTGEIFNFTLF